VGEAFDLVRHPRSDLAVILLVGVDLHGRVELGETRLAGLVRSAPHSRDHETFAQRECLGAFEPYVGISAFDSTLFFTWMVPSLEGWNTKKDRDVLCVLGAEDGRQLTKSMKGTNL
jgi:hypothetical protein